MKILVTGAGGLVGRHLVKGFSGSDEVTALGHSELNIADQTSVERCVENLIPDMIINCAVVGVDACEDDPALAYAVNVAGPINLARCAAEVGAKLVHFSTNYVFDGKKTKGSYTMDDEPRPINVYGRTKLAGEMAVVAACSKSFIIRTSWVFGPGKQSFLSSVHKSLAAGEKVSAITDMRASATFVKDLVSRVQTIVPLQHYGTYHVVNSGICSYYDFAMEAAGILKIPGSEAMRLVEPISVSRARKSAPRPLVTPMSCKLSQEIGLPPMRAWQEALKDFISQ